MKIRQAGKDDLKRIVEIFRQEYARYPYNEKWPKKFAKLRIKNYFKNCKIFVLEIDDKIQGFVIGSFYIWHNGLRGYIDEVVVTHEFQGLGYGKRLMEFIENYFRRKKAKEISLITSKKSIAYNIIIFRIMR